ncbi:very short patch repair endonuclease [Roseomonas gilardii]|uniref:Very short patch repair endonuclease n=1 Tax=Roseomonas gilardii TaxID=257708 RepID=A0ABU3MPL2_9PROT|nr:very short patch repair endonuclease [Roseomonas gilardii]MDT8333794.1 very short patch repair endonuclease [Roseomonas gilardii]
MDILTPEQRRFNMSRIRGRDTKPEMLIRRGLHAMGLRFRVQRKDLPGRPDLVFAGHYAAVFVHGCFWHGHSCPLCCLPATRTDFWRAKLDANRQRDEKALLSLKNLGWRTLVVWECALRGRARRDPGLVLDQCAGFIRSGEAHGEIAGDWQGPEACPGGLPPRPQET